MGYSKENTIVMWIDDKHLSIMTIKIAKELKLNVLEAEVESDLYGYPYFFAIIDSRKLDNSILENLAEIYSSENPKRFGILLTSECDFKIPSTIKNLFVKPPNKITSEWLRTTIINRQHFISRHRDN